MTALPGNEQKFWNVYVRGRFVGVVEGVNADAALDAALSDFDVDEEVGLTVCLRAPNREFGDGYPL